MGLNGEKGEEFATKSENLSITKEYAWIVEMLRQNVWD